MKLHQEHAQKPGGEVHFRSITEAADAGEAADGVAHHEGGHRRGVQAVKGPVCLGSLAKLLLKLVNGQLMAAFNDAGHHLIGGRLDEVRQNEWQREDEVVDVEKCHAEEYFPEGKLVEVLKKDGNVRHQKEGGH